MTLTRTCDLPGSEPVRVVGPLQITSTNFSCLHKKANITCNILLTRSQVLANTNFTSRKTVDTEGM